ncbi:unnamed protein product [Heligmosomoides polygyrus]|uniref:ANAPC4_WD40 domain-containing protein n=1 Tax=Heligmosomoides polygyrus TaxID=6339 RepID=A0A3P8EJY8_HELPZ|nr:unnamed protein product [Heligmosomoides polygyrus]
MIQLVAFRSSITHQPTTNSNVQTKVTTLEPKGDIVSIGLNADETLLGVLGSTPQGCFVFVYDVRTLSADVPGEAFPLSTVRVGNSASKGLAFEWNPALPDTFAASDNERTLSVAKIDLQNSSKYSVLGEKKLETNVSEISWSPKGKQLVVGDSRGKIYQLKPELELVRMTNAPENAGSVVVVNLSWLSTTDWLVAYSNQEMTTSGTFMLSIKKDKPPSWTPMNFPAQSSLGITRRLLVDWNVALVVCPSSAELVVVCKPTSATAWTTSCIASVPRPSNTAFAIGVAVDLSSQNPVSVGDGSTRRLPVVVVLNSDGSLVSFQLMPPSKDFPDCNISPDGVDVSKITNGLRQTVASSNVAAPVGVSASPVQQTSLFGSFALKKTDSPSLPPAITTTSTTAPSFGIFGGAQAPASSASATLTQTLPSGGAVTQSAATSFQKPLSGGLFSGFQGFASGEKPAAASLCLAPQTQSSVSSGASFQKATSPVKQEGPDPAEVAKAAVAAARASAKKSIEEFSANWHEFHSDLHAFVINMQRVGGFINESIASLTHTDNMETVDEIHRMIVELDDEMNAMQEMLADRRNLVSERMAFEEEFRDSHLNLRHAIDPFERIQSERVLQKYEDFTLKMHEAKKLIAATRKISVACKPRRVAEFDPKFEGRMHDSMKNLSRFAATLRSRVDELERKALLNTTSGASSNPNMSSTTFAEAPSAVFTCSYPPPVRLERGKSRAELRARLLEVLNAKKGVKATIKKLEALRIDSAPSDDTLSSSFLNASNLESSLLQKITSPLKPKAVSSMRNASTQADAPVQPASAAQPIPSSKADSSLLFSGFSTSLLDDKKSTGTGGSTNKEKKDEKQSATIGEKASTEATEGEKKEEKRTSLFGTLSSSGSAEKKEDKPTSLFGGIGSSTSEKKEEKQTIFGGTATGLSAEKKDDKPSLFVIPGSSTEKKDEKPFSSLFGGASATPNVEKKEEKPFSSLFGGAAATANAEKKDEGKPSIFGGMGEPSSFAPSATTTQGTPTTTQAQTSAQTSAFGSIFGSKPSATAGATASTSPPTSVTFSFKPKTTTAETTQPAATSAVFNFGSKPAGTTLGFAAAAATAAPSVDADEGMDDDGAAGGATSQTTGSIFGGGFMRFSGNKNLFGGASTGGGSSLFGGGMTSQSQPKPSSLFGGGQHASSFSTWR